MNALAFLNELKLHEIFDINMFLSCVTSTFEKASG
jgi:hypothetical protein